MRNFLRFFTLSLFALCLIGCGATLPKVKPFKMDIQQGNVVTSEMLLKLRPGMTKSQVKFIMGTPLLVDSFRTNRWDYFYQLRKQGKILNQRRVILDFEDDLLKRVRGDVVPQGQTAEDLKQKLEEEAGGADAAPEEASSEPLVEAVEPPDVKLIEDATGNVEAALPAPVTEASEQAQAVDAATGEAIEAAQDVAEQAVVETEAPAPIAVPEQPSAPEVVESVNELVPEAQVDEVPEQLAVPVMPEADQVKDAVNVVPTKADEGRLVFRLDRSLDTTRIIPAEVATSEAPLQDSVVQEVTEAAGADAAEDPSFFERMLEKIGF